MFDKIHKISNNIIFKGIKINNQPNWVQNSLDILDNLTTNTETNLARYKNIDINELKETSIVEKKIIADTISDGIIDGVISYTPIPVQCGLHLIIAAKEDLTTFRDEQREKLTNIFNAMRQIANNNEPGEKITRIKMTYDNLPLILGHMGISASGYIADTLISIKDYISTKLINVFDTYEDILTTPINIVKEYVYGLKPQIENIISKFKNPHDITNYDKSEVLSVYKTSNITTSNKSSKQLQSIKNYEQIIKIQKEENKTVLSEAKQLEIKRLHVEKFIKVNENISVVGSISAQLLSLNGYHKEAKIISGFTNFHNCISSTVANIKLNKFSFASMTNIISGTLELIGILSNNDSNKALEQIHDHITKCTEAVIENINIMRKEISIELNIMRQENTNNFNKIYEQLANIEVHIVTEIISASQINRISLLTLEQHIKTNSMYWERQHNTNERILERFNQLQNIIVNMDTRNYLNDMILRNNEIYYNTDKLQYSYYRNSMVALLNQSHNINITHGNQPITQIGFLDNFTSFTICNAKNASQLVNIRGCDIDGIYFIDKYIFKITNDADIECNIIDGYLPLYILQQLHNIANYYNKRLVINDNTFEYEIKEIPQVCMHPLIFKLHFQTLLYSMLKMYNEADTNLIRINFEEIKQIQDITNILQNNITMFTTITRKKDEIYTELLNRKSVLYNQLKSDYIKCLNDEKTIYMDTMLTDFRTKTLPDMYKSPPKIFNTNNIYKPDLVDYMGFHEEGKDHTGVGDYENWYKVYYTILHSPIPQTYIDNLNSRLTNIEQIKFNTYKTTKVDLINKINYNSKVNNMYTLTNINIMELDKLPIFIFPINNNSSFNIDEILVYELELNNYRTYYLASLYGLGKFEGTYRITCSNIFNMTVTINFTSPIMELNNTIHTIIFKDDFATIDYYVKHHMIDGY